MGQGTRRPAREGTRPAPRPPGQRQGELPREGLRQHERAGLLRREATLRGKLFLLDSSLTWVQDILSYGIVHDSWVSKSDLSQDLTLDDSRSQILLPTNLNLTLRTPPSSSPCWSWARCPSARPTSRRPCSPCRRATRSTGPPGTPWTRTGSAGGRRGARGASLEPASVLKVQFLSGISHRKWNSLMGFVSDNQIQW